MSTPEPSGLLFKHKDTKLLVALSAAFVALAALAGWLLDDTAAILLALTLMLIVLIGLLLHLRRSRQAENVQHLRHVQALQWLHDTLSLRAPLPPLTGWAANPELLCTLVALIRRHQPRRVVELGSGASTLVMAYALDQADNGRVLALDHLEQYADQSASRIDEHHLQDRADVRHAPLRAREFDGQTWQWYDTQVLNDGETIDMLVIDGPPRETQPMARYPALPALFERLHEDAVIVLDDARRADEQKILEAWVDAYPSLTLEMQPSPKGTAVLYKGDLGRP